MHLKHYFEAESDLTARRDECLGNDTMYWLGILKMCLKQQSIKGAPPLEILLTAVVSQGTFNRHCQFMDEVESSVLRATRFLEKFGWDSVALFSAQSVNVSSLRC